MEIRRKQFGELNGIAVESFTLVNDQGMEVTCLNYGCIITEIKVPDREGQIENVVLGFDNLEDYIQHSPYFGAICGRVAGRIRNAQFQLDGETYTLAQNDGVNHLHGGEVGFDKVIWEADIVESEQGATIEFHRTSPDGEEGYPGNLHLKVTYTLTNENAFIIQYHGTTDKKTLVNVTNHSYFNLSGNAKRDILEHELTLKSHHFLELTPELLPTGVVAEVEGTTFDFRQGRKIKEGTTSSYTQNVIAGAGYDHPFQLSENFSEEIILKDHESGRVMTIETDEPFVVLYTGNMMDDSTFINGVRSRKYLALCLETQGAPDAIHFPELPSVILDKGEEYSRKTIYTFSTF